MSFGPYRVVLGADHPEGWGARRVRAFDLNEATKALQMALRSGKYVSGVLQERKNG